MISKKTKVLAVLVAIVMVVTLAGCSKSAAPAQQKAWAPDKPITFTAVAGAGGGLDLLARTTAKLLDQSKLVTQPIMVENKPGGGQVTGTVAFATKEAKNDYAVMIASTPFIINHIKKDGNSPIGPEDIYPVAMVQGDYGVIAVKADSKYKTLKDLFDAVKADPTKVQFVGGGAPGTWDHLNIIQIASKAGVDLKSMKYNPYDGGGEALTALLGGHGDAMTSDVSSVKQYVQAGKVRVLGVSAPAKMADDEIMKDIPTYKEAGYDVTTVNWRGFFIGKDASEGAKKFWGDTIDKLVKTPEWKAELKKAGLVDIYKDSKTFFDFIKAEEKVYTDLYTKLGMPIQQ
ncbi:MAG: tripartite tricarboxylate transporter substrate binding protein [Peptococcaceae bacterium]|nr:tripartite tricarboxylate transporter substrate binding protein [Peptococcaceae bacterium]